MSSLLMLVLFASARRLLRTDQETVPHAVRSAVVGMGNGEVMAVGSVDRDVCDGAGW